MFVYERASRISSPKYMKGGGLDIICAGAMGARRGEAGVASTGLGGVEA